MNRFEMAANSMRRIAWMFIIGPVLGLLLIPIGLTNWSPPWDKLSTLTPLILDVLVLAVILSALRRLRALSRNVHWMKRSRAAHVFLLWSLILTVSVLAARLIDSHWAVDFAVIILAICCVITHFLYLIRLTQMCGLISVVCESVSLNRSARRLLWHLRALLVVSLALPLSVLMASLLAVQLELEARVAVAIGALLVQLSVAIYALCVFIAQIIVLFDTASALHRHALAGRA